MLIFKEIPSAIKIGGGIMILIGIFVVSLSQSTADKAKPDEMGHLP
jgi:drug/metabolite transporter (DMT)-like permease